MDWLRAQYARHREVTKAQALKKVPTVSLERLVASQALRAGDVLLVRSNPVFVGADVHCHPQIARGVAASCRVPCNKRVTLDGWTQVHVVLGGDVAACLHARHVESLDEAAAKAYVAHLTSKVRASPRASRAAESSRRLAHGGGGEERAILSAGPRGLTIQALNAAWASWQADPSTVVALRRLEAPSEHYRHYLEEAFDQSGEACLAFVEAATGRATSGAVMLSWHEAVRCDRVGGVAADTLRAVNRALAAPLPNTKTQATDAFFRYDTRDRGKLDFDAAVAALESIPGVALKSPDVRADLRRHAPTDDDLDMAAFQRVCDAILDEEPAPHLDRDAYGALAAGFVAAMLKAMAAIDVPVEAPGDGAPVAPTTASFGEDDPALDWKPGFGLERLIRVDIEPLQR